MLNALNKHKESHETTDRKACKGKTSITSFLKSWIREDGKVAITRTILLESLKKRTRKGEQRKGESGGGAIV